MQWGVNKLERILLLWRHDERVFNESNEVSRKSKKIFFKKKNLNYTWLVPLNTTSTYYTMRMMMIIEKPSGRNEQSIIVGTWSWIGCEIRARTSFWEVSLLWCPGGPFADWPSMSSPHCWGAQCSKKSQKVVCLLSLILGTVSVKQWRKNKY